MWSPALAALVASILTRRSLKAIGWRPWPLKWLAAGWLFPILYAFPAYALVWVSGLGSVPNPTFLERARLTLNMPDQPNWLVIVSAFGFITILNLLPGMILSLGEEIGWRGFLVPELTKWTGFRRASLWSGAIWCTWHLPGIVSGGYGAAGTPRLYQLACFAGMVLTTGVALAWLRMKSGSLWPAAIMHATHNGVIQAFFDRITADTGRTRYFTGEFGIALLPFTLALAWYCWHRSDAAEIAAAAE
jgi:membrane protease YdiL (CAAX protease family)